MRKLFLTFVISLCTLAGFAQDGVRELRKGWYVSLQGGGVYSMSENCRYASFGDMITPAGALSVGKEFSYGYGARLQFYYGKDKGKMNKYINPPYAGAEYEFKDFSVFVDATFNLTYLLNSNHPKYRPFEIYGFAGLGLVYTHDMDLDGCDYKTVGYDLDPSDRANLGIRAGFIGAYHLNKAWDLSLELGMTAITDKFNGVKAGMGVDMRANAMLGLVYHF